MRDEINAFACLRASIHLSDITFDEFKIGGILKGFDVFIIPCEKIVEYLDFLRAIFDEVFNDMRTDETSTARDEKCIGREVFIVKHGFCLLFPNLKNTILNLVEFIKHEDSNFSPAKLHNINQFIILNKNSIVI